MKINQNEVLIKGIPFYTVEIFLPKTTLLIVGNENGYFMCGALDVDLFNNTPRLKERGIVAGRALGVKTIDELLNAKLDKITDGAKKMGVFEGMLVKDALLLLA